MTLSATVTLHVLPVPGPSFLPQTACPHRRAHQRGPPPPHPGAPEVGRWARAPLLQTPDWGRGGGRGRHSQEVGPGQLSSPRFWRSGYTARGRPPEHPAKGAR